MSMKKLIAVLLLIVMAVTLTACGSNDSKPAPTAAPTAAPAAETASEPKAEEPAKEEKTEEKPAEAAPAAAAPANDHPLNATYGFQWSDPTAPILNEKGAQELSFQVYSSKNASALDYNDMKIMADLFAQTNVQVNWENVSESVYSQQKNLIFGNKDNRPDAIYHAGMGAGEIITICPTSKSCWKNAPTSRPSSSTLKTAKSTPCPASRKWACCKAPTCCS